MISFMHSIFFLPFSFLLGYENPEGTGNEHRIFFHINRKINDEVIHMHLHLMWKTSNKWKDYLLFRDYLRVHKDEANRYYELKKIWLKAAKKGLKKFSELKTEYIYEILKKAKKSLNLTY